MISPESHQTSQSQDVFKGHLDNLERVNGSIGRIEYGTDKSGRIVTRLHPRWSLFRWVYNKVRHRKTHRELHDLAIQALTNDTTARDLKLRVVRDIQQGSFPFVSQEEKRLITENAISKTVIADRRVKADRVLKAEYKELIRQLPDVDVEHTTEYLKAYCTIALLSPDKLAGKHQAFETTLKNHFREFGQQEQFQNLKQNCARNAISEAAKKLAPDDFMEIMQSARRVPWGARGRLIHGLISTTLHNNTRAIDKRPITLQDMDLVTFWGKHFENHIQVTVQSHLSSDLKAIMANEELKKLEQQADATFVNQLKACVDKLQKCSKAAAGASDYTSRQESKEQLEAVKASMEDQLELARRCRQKLHFINGALLSQWDRDILRNQEYAGKQASAIYRRLEIIDKLYGEIESYT